MKIFKNYLYNVGYQVFSIIVPVITTPYISRVLGTSGVGVNAYTNSVIQYFVLAGNIGINLYGNRIIAYQRDNRRKMSQTFWSVEFLRIIAMIIAYAGFLMFLIVSKKYRLAYLLQSIQIIAVAFDISWLFMGVEDFKRTVIRNLWVKVLSTISIFLFVKDVSDIYLYIAIIALSSFVGNITLWGHLKGFIDGPVWPEIHIFAHLKGSIALFIPQMAMQVYLILNKTMLGDMKGVTSVGFYDSADKIVKISLTIVTAISTVMIPRMANMFARKKITELNKLLYQSLDFVTCISLLLTAGLAAMAPKFSIWFMGSEFAQTGPLMAVLSLVCPIISWSTVLGSQYLVTTGKENLFTVSVVVGAFVNVVANLIFISCFGTMGAIVATVLSELIITLVDMFFTWKYVSLGPALVGIWKYIISGILTYIAVAYLNANMSFNVLSLMLQVFVGILVYLVTCVFLRAPFLKSFLSFIHARKLE